MGGWGEGEEEEGEGQGGWEPPRTRSWEDDDMFTAKDVNLRSGGRINRSRATDSGTYV